MTDTWLLETAPVSRNIQYDFPGVRPCWVGMLQNWKVETHDIYQVLVCAGGQIAWFSDGSRSWGGREWADDLEPSENQASGQTDMTQLPGFGISRPAHEISRVWWIMFWKVLNETLSNFFLLKLSLFRHGVSLLDGPQTTMAKLTRSAIGQLYRVLSQLLIG